MEKATILVLALLATGFFSCRQKAVPTTENTIKEIAVYRIKPEKMAEFPALLEAVAREVRQMPGCLNYTSMKQSAEENPMLPGGNTFVDICEWRSLAEAQAANSKTQTSPSPAVQAFFAAFDTIIVFGHFDYMYKATK